jgi:hypothetical protein
VETVFTVYPGQAIAPAGAGVIGPLSVAGSLTLRGDTLIDIGKSGTTLAADVIDATGTVDLGGTLKVTLSGSHDSLAAGDKFYLFTVPPVNSSPSIKLPPPGSGLAWANKILIDGSIEVIPCGCGEPTTSPTLTISASPTSATVSWPAAYTSFALRAQTNGLSAGWGLVPGVAGNAVTIPINSANRSVVFQLIQQ